FVAVTSSVYFTYCLTLPSSSPLLPYTTLFRSRNPGCLHPDGGRVPRHAADQSAAGAAADRSAQPPQAGGHRRPDRAHRVDEYDRDRKSTRLNSSHVSISYAVFCWKKKRHSSVI